MIDEDLIPADGYFKQCLDAIARSLDDHCQRIDFQFKVPDEEQMDKVVYLELVPCDLVVESLQGTQRSLLPFHVDLIGFIRHKDPEVGLNFAWEIAQALLTPEAVERFNNAFTDDPDVGFAIEAIRGIDSVTTSSTMPGRKYSQIRMRLEITFGA